MDSKEVVKLSTDPFTKLDFHLGMMTPEAYVPNGTYFVVVNYQPLHPQRRP